MQYKNLFILFGLIISILNFFQNTIEPNHIILIYNKIFQFINIIKYFLC
jgi:hypothetical protein